MGKRLGAFIVANIAIFVYALLAEAFGFLLGFNILAAGVWVIVLLIRKVSRKTS